jgi:hypothetical protein
MSRDEEARLIDEIGVRSGGLFVQRSAFGHDGLLSLRASLSC